MDHPLLCTAVPNTIAPLPISRTSLKPIVFAEVQRLMARMQQRHSTNTDLVLIWLHFGKTKSRQEALVNIQALFGCIRGKWGTFLTKNRYWFKLGQSISKNVDTQNWGAIKMPLEASRNIGGISHVSVSMFVNTKDILNPPTPSEQHLL